MKRKETVWAVAIMAWSRTAIPPTLVSHVRALAFSGKLSMDDAERKAHESARLFYPQDQGWEYTLHASRQLVGK